jgi:Protein of unknown function (DUF995)
MTRRNVFEHESWSGNGFEGLLRGVAFVVVSMTLSAPSPSFAQVAVPAEARAMTGFELFMTFREKTWKWADGAGRMQDEGRLFKAWTQSGEDASWAEGRWTVTNDGRLCLKAVWHSQSAEARSTTCFSHRIFGGTIYQKKEPAGDWYVFKHGRPTKEDEFNKLVSEDLVATRLPGIQSLEGPVSANKSK